MIIIKFISDSGRSCRRWVMSADTGTYDSEQKKMERRKLWTNIAIWAAAIVVITVMRFRNGNSSMIALSKEGMTLHSSAGTETVLVWDDIEGVELREDLSYGTVKNGTDNNKEKSGTWTNDEFGDYELYVDPAIGNCIVMSLKDGRKIVINFESEKTTEGLVDAVAEMLE